MTGLRIAVTRLGLAVTMIVAAFAAVRDEVAWLRQQPAADHLRGWSASEDERLQRGLGLWHPTVVGLRKLLPESAVSGGWVHADEPPAEAPEIFNLYRIMLAPRICVPLRSADDLLGWRRPMFESGRPLFVIEVHPEFGPPWARGRRPPRPNPELGAIVMVAEHPDFTLHEIRPPR